METAVGLFSIGYIASITFLKFDFPRFYTYFFAFPQSADEEILELTSSYQLNGHYIYLLVKILTEAFRNYGV